MIRPSGPGLRLSSSAPNAFVYQSSAALHSSNVRIGVTVLYPSGTGLFAGAMIDSFDGDCDANVGVVVV
jgi:hypothetical protein